jgi:hypothetical protein
MEGLNGETIHLEKGSPPQKRKKEKLHMIECTNRQK